ncbi:hypothetical protein ATPR_0252 [Acetobacter tropicalis NBRC 101654]|uniref:Uncharacterized protein n=1 Tax=Acetobacter tropicalis NBRC 101654 TaxID=749388 RepID=F7VA53_9PROT|nr:hypothetical protein ATPR_0252 [Acetobacter tropicalis NBRC 101654]
MLLSSLWHSLPQGIYVFSLKIFVGLTLYMKCSIFFCLTSSLFENYLFITLF